MSVKKLTIGNQSFSNNIIQGPLAGYSNAPFRLLTWQYGHPAFSCTEMISSKAIMHQSLATTQRYVQIDPNEGPVCFQISGNDPKYLAEAAKKITDLGATLIDLNCGCPVTKIRKKGIGSSLLASPSKLYQLISSLKNSTHLPISIKIRVDGQQDSFNREIATVVQEAGTDCLIVHGRHWTDGYEIPCRYDEIRFFVDELTIPVIGNGDIACNESLNAMYATGCAGVMISRAGVGQPWLINKLRSESNGEQTTPPPPPSEIANIFLQHVAGLINLFGNEKFAVIQARKLTKYYARGLRNKNDLMTRVNACSDFNELKKLCHDYFID